MRLLEQRIIKDGKVLPGDVLKIDSFLNHQIDVELLRHIGNEFKMIFSDCEINKILTIEASGIGVACVTAQFFCCPVVFAKKSKTSNISDSFFVSEVKSYTHNTTSKVVVSKEYLSESDNVLIVDDFLANGCALTGLIDIVNQSGARLAGCGIVVEKGYQPGGAALRQKGVRIESLAVVESMDSATGEIHFRH